MVCIDLQNRPYEIAREIHIPRGSSCATGSCDNAYHAALSCFANILHSTGTVHIFSHGITRSFLGEQQ